MALGCRPELRLANPGKIAFEATVAQIRQRREQSLGIRRQFAAHHVKLDSQRMLGNVKQRALARSNWPGNPQCHHTQSPGQNVAPAQNPIDHQLRAPPRGIVIGRCRYNDFHPNNIAPP
jgi:hypothetical protein